MLPEDMAKLLKAGRPAYPTGITQFCPGLGIAQLNGHANEGKKGAGDRRSFFQTKQAPERFEKSGARPCHGAGDTQPTRRHSLCGQQVCNELPESRLLRVGEKKGLTACALLRCKKRSLANIADVARLIGIPALATTRGILTKASNLS